jgi:dTDP-4-dehydrorhamnose 3,5-epimerase
MSSIRAMSTQVVVDGLEPAHVHVPRCEKGLGTVIQSLHSDGLIEGVRIEHLPVWPDDRGHFLEVLRVGRGLAGHFPQATTQVSATATFPAVVKAFHYHLRQYDCWTVVKGMLQISLADMRTASPTFGRRNTMYVGDLRPWQVLIPPGVAHGYKVIGVESAVLVYVTSRLYDPSDECRLRFDDGRLNYDWDNQFK